MFSAKNFSDDQTLAYYRQNATEVFARHSAIPTEDTGRYFLTVFEDKSAPLLDFGAGSGRDLDFLLRQGYNAWGYDPCAELVALASGQYEAVRGRYFTLPGLLPARKFRGLLCQAVAQHIPEDSMANFALGMQSLLEINGQILLSVPVRRSDVGQNSRDHFGRLQIIRPVAYYQILFQDFHFRLVSIWHTPVTDAASAVQIWATMVFRRMA